MSRLTELEIKIRHGVCGVRGCAICNERPIERVAQRLNELGLHVRKFSDDEKTRFAFVDVEEDERTCSSLLKGRGPESIETKRT